MDDIKYRVALLKNIAKHAQRLKRACDTLSYDPQDEDAWDIMHEAEKLVSAMGDYRWAVAKQLPDSNHDFDEDIAWAIREAVKEDAR